MVRPVRASRGKHAHFLFTTQSRRSHHFRPTFLHRIVKQELHPNIFKPIQSAHAIGGKFGIQRDADFRMRHQLRLARNPEFLRIGRRYRADTLHQVLHNGLSEHWKKCRLLFKRSKAACTWLCDSIKSGLPRQH